jgi:hypothetical protein
MRGTLVGLCFLALTSVTWATDRSLLLLSDNSALLAPETPAAVAEYLTLAWGALICVPAGGSQASREQPYVQAQVLLPMIPVDSAQAVDSLRAWRSRWGLTLALFPGDGKHDGAARAAKAAGLTVFRDSHSFGRGDAAVPDGETYHYYHGERSWFFRALGGLVQTADSGAVDLTGQTRLNQVAAELTTHFATTPDATAFKALRGAVGAADSLAATEDPESALAGRYAQRWRRCLAFWLAPRAASAPLEIFTGLPEIRTVTLRSTVPVPLTIEGVRTSASQIDIDWQTEFPLQLSAGGTVVLSGRFKAIEPGTAQISLNLDLAYRGLAFTGYRTLAVLAAVPLELRFDPPIIYASEGTERTDPDYLVRVSTGSLVAKNWSDMPLKTELAWTAEDPIDISATQRELILQPGEERSLSFTLSMPRELKYREYGFSVKTGGSDSPSADISGRLWREAPKIAGGVHVGVAGDAPHWLEALRGVRIAAAPLVPDQLDLAKLNGFGAIIVAADCPQPSPQQREALHRFCRSGRTVLIDLSRSAAAWLPWATSLVRRPGPFAATFYQEELSWWQTPNGLVGGCFAAPDHDTVFTLPAGAEGWEPLVVDDGGKGFMYRRRAGDGWYVVIHNGWGPRLADLDRRALLGLINLVSTR